MPPRHFLILFSLFISIASGAQFKKGSRMVGTSIASGLFSSGTTTYTYPASQGYSSDNNSFSITITPSYGWFINNQAVAGFSLLVNSSYQKTNNKSVTDTIFSSSKNTNTDLGLGTFFRYYISTDKSLKPFIHVFANGGTGFGSSNGFTYGTDNFGTYKDSYDGKSSGRVFFNGGLNLGVTKMIGGQIGIDAFAGYVFSYSKYKTETTSVRDYVAINGPDDLKKFEPMQKFTGNGLNVGIGLQVFLD